MRAPPFSPGDLTLRQRLLLAAILIFGAAIRLHFDNVRMDQFYRADEQYYTDDTRHLAEGGGAGLPDLNASFRNNPVNWLFPSPLRWGYLAMTSAACKLTGTCDQRTLAGLSTLAGIASLALTCLVGLELLGRAEALVATALCATSPLQLALGRRALQDEVYCAIVLAAIWLLARAYRQRPGARPTLWYAAAILAMTWAWSVKESFVLLYPALAGLLLARAGRRPLRISDGVLFCLPPILNYACFSLLSGNLTEYFEIGRLTVSTVGASYAVQYQSGPPHRLLLDMMAISPIVLLLAVAATSEVARRWRDVVPGARQLVVGLAALLVVYSLFPSKNLRYIVVADPLVRLLAGWLLVRCAAAWRGRAWAVVTAVVLLNGAAELAIFHTVFIAHQVYDPVTDSVLRALRMLPRS